MKISSLVLDSFNAQLSEAVKALGDTVQRDEPIFDNRDVVWKVGYLRGFCSAFCLNTFGKISSEAWDTLSAIALEEYL